MYPSILHQPVAPGRYATAVFVRAKAAKTPAEAHIFEEGGHGFGIRGTRGLPLAEWPRLALTWMSSIAESSDR